jgi:LacI family transcriptional regulator
MAAEHFLERGFRSFAFVGYRQQEEKKDRRVGFQRRLKAEGFSCACYTKFDLPILRDGGLWGVAEPAFEKWLHALTKPVAVFAYQDFLGWEVAELCLNSKLEVPAEVAIVGVDDDELFCELSHPKLSSVAYPGEAIGYEAARLLASFLDAKKSSSSRRQIFLPPLRIVMRQSSDILALEDQNLNAALRFIRAHEGEPIAVKNVMQAVSISRRSLEQKFRLNLGRSPLQEILRVHTDRARRLLAETKLSIAEIAERSGFVSPERLSVIFKKKGGISPRQYRMKYSAI